MTETFEEYLKDNDVVEFKCAFCKNSVDYQLGNSDGICKTCMKQDYEENKK